MRRGAGRVRAGVADARLRNHGIREERWKIRHGYSEDAALAAKLSEGYRQILSELRKVIIAQDAVVEQVMISLMVGAHSMITGVPGLAKTLLIKTLARALDLRFKRIQFTPDLMPADITGTDIIQEDAVSGRREPVFVKGRFSPTSSWPTRSTARPRKPRRRCSRRWRSCR